MSNEHTETQPRPNGAPAPGHKDLAANSATQTQDRPNLSTEHQHDGDARRPSDTLDRAQGDTPGGKPQEAVEDRPVVGTVKPEDYPKDLPDH